MLKCRSCLSENLVSIIPLGCLPLANALVTTPTELSGTTHNLEVMLCNDCGLAQLKDLIDPKNLFSDYVYFSSNSESMLTSVACLVDRIVPTLNADSLVIEIASNDGYLLKNYVNKNVKVLGIDPAENIAKVANKNGVPTLCAFFGEDLATELTQQNKKADVIHANNVMAHIPDINGFVKGLKILLKKNGTAIIEVPHFLELVKKLEFDTIYHEHVYYFSVYALHPIFSRYGLEIYDIERISLHGGSLRLFVSHIGFKEINPIINEIIAEELFNGLNQRQTYIKFMNKVEQLQKSLKEKLNDLKSQGASIAAYGASAKGTTLLNYFGIANNLIDFVVDRSPVKQGMYTPGTSLEISCPSNLVKKNITHALLLSWNFKDEIMQQQKEFLNGGGKFIVPLPEVKILP
ncbi:MAG: class I SAM-dependent methyltransferase [Alphaproteobacteria bacterium]